MTDGLCLPGVSVHWSSGAGAPATVTWIRGDVPVCLPGVEVETDRFEIGVYLLKVGDYYLAFGDGSGTPSVTITQMTVGGYRVTVGGTPLTF